MQVTLQLDEKKKVQAVYFKLRPGKVHETQEPYPEVFVDFDKEGNVLGVEVLSPDPATARFIDQLAADYNLEGLQNSHPEKLQAAFA